MNRLTIRTKLFLTYAVLMIGVVTLMCVIYYFYSEEELNRSAYDSLSQSARNLSVQLELQMRDLDSVTTKVIMSADIKETFFRSVRGGDAGQNLSNLRQQSGYLYSIMGPMSLDWQINLINNDGSFMSVGNYSFEARFPREVFQNIDWLQDVYEADGSRVVTKPHPDYFRSSPEPVISIARAFGEHFESPKTAIVEVQQNYDSLVRFIAGFFERSHIGYMDSVRIYVVNQDGETIFPRASDPVQAEESEGLLLWKQLQSDGAGQQAALFTSYNNANGERDVVAYSTSAYTGWTTMLVLPQGILLSHTGEFWRLALLLLLPVLIVTMLISYLVAKGLTNPIRGMYKSIQTLLPPEFDVPPLRGGSELVNLERIFQEMAAQLKASMEQTISIRSMEMEARMVALQSQMNPHMLHNTISTIHVLAEEQGDAKIMKICQSMNHMFHYILSNSRRDVTVKDEVAYISDYLALQKVRYGDYLECAININERLMDIVLPKLIIQPLVENCIKHGASAMPPSRISITGAIEGSVWTIRVEDNGAGFDPQVISNWRSIRTSQQTGYGVSGASAHGVGLKNTYERLLLFFGEDMIFKMFNKPEGGACVLFGSIDRSGVHDANASG